MDEKIVKIMRFAADIRKQTIRALQSVGFGHIGGSMSIADVLAVLYGDEMKIDPEKPDWPERDWLILSKGHTGPALYATLALKGYFPLELLSTLNKPGTTLPSHCDANKTRGVDMTTGSLGQGASAAMGIALGNRLKGLSNWTYLIVGDGELQEGQVWESIEFAAHQALDHVIMFVDENKKQLDGKVCDICNPYDILQKISSFGWSGRRVKGYDVKEIRDAIAEEKKILGKPSVIVLDTMKGIGCNFAEKVAFNHYMVITQEMADDAIEEIERRYKEQIDGGGVYVPPCV